MVKIEISEHFKQTRADRYVYIMSTLGLGEIVHSYKQPNTKYKSSPTAIVNITTTGIALVTTPAGKVITMYVLTLSEARKYFENDIPLLLASIIRENMYRKHHIKQNQVHY